MSDTAKQKGTRSKSKTVIYAALAGNVAIAVTKLIAATIGGSSSMLTEGFHSLVDSVNECLLLYGQHRSQQPADAKHPLGYGRELYFWSFVVALLIFTGGAGASIYEGIRHVQTPEMPGRPVLNYVVLGIAFLFESATLSLAVREFVRKKNPDESWWKALRSSKDPAVFVIMLEDSAALIGITVAAVFIGLSLLTGNPVWDGVGSIIIGTVLVAVAALLAIECKGLLVGESADPDLDRALREFVSAQAGVIRINELLTIQQAPDQIIAVVSIEFEDRLDVTDIEQLAGRIEAQARAEHPAIRRVFIRPQSRAATIQDTPA